MGSQAEFAREYFNMYQNCIKLIVEEQRKIMNSQTDVQAIMDEAVLEESPNSKLFC